MSVAWYPVIDGDKCTECGVCVEFCKHDVYDKSSIKPLVIAPENCIEGCHGCQPKCPAEAISYFGEGTVQSGSSCACGCSCSGNKPALDPQAICGILPQLDCNKCGYATCLEFAGTLANGESEPEDCPVLTNPRFTQQLFGLRKLMEGR